MQYGGVVRGEIARGLLPGIGQEPLPVGLPGFAVSLSGRPPGPDGGPAPRLPLPDAGVHFGVEGGQDAGVLQELLFGVGVGVPGPGGHLGLPAPGLQYRAVDLLPGALALGELAGGEDSQVVVPSVAGRPGRRRRRQVGPLYAHNGPGGGGGGTAVLPARPGGGRLPANLGRARAVRLPGKRAIRPPGDAIGSRAVRVVSAKRAIRPPGDAIGGGAVRLPGKRAILAPGDAFAGRLVIVTLAVTGIGRVSRVGRRRRRAVLLRRRQRGRPLGHGLKWLMGRAGRVDRPAGWTRHGSPPFLMVAPKSPMGRAGSA